MRTADEVMFRVRQELANLRLYLSLSSTPAIQELPLAGLPDVMPVVENLRGTGFSADVERLAQSTLQHRVPMPGGIVETGDRIDWRRDYRNGVTSHCSYSRLIPYLDFRKVGDHKTIWDLNRHQHLVVLAQAFRLTRYEEFLSELQRQLASWLDDNPFMRGINWTSALEVGFRTLSWIWMYHLVGDRLKDDLRQKLVAGLFRHGCYLEHNLSIYFSPNTHLLGEAVSLHALGTLFPRFRTANRWKRIGGDLVLLQMASQVRDDGSHFEQSTYYHVYALDFFLFHQVLAETTAEFRSKLWRMADYLHTLMGRTRTLPFLGDDDGGRVFHPYSRRDRFGRATLATCAVLFNETKWPYEEADLYEQAVWWLGPRTLGRQVREAQTESESRLFRDSGIAVMTSDQIEMLVDAGPFGTRSGGHSHSDTLSLVVRCGHEEILVDAGTYTYVADAELRDWFRGSAAHNTVRIDGLDQAVPAGPFRWLAKPDVEVLEWTSRSDYDLLDAICRYQTTSSRQTASARVVHRRRVLLIKKRNEQVPSDVVIICDLIDGPPGSHFVEQFWHPGETVTPEADGRVRIGSQCRLVIGDAGLKSADAGLKSRATYDKEDGWRSRVFGDKVPAATLVVRRNCVLPCHLWAALSVGETQDAPPLRLTFQSADEAVLELPGERSVAVRFGVPGSVPYAFTKNVR